VHGLDIEIGLDVESVADYSRGLASFDRSMVSEGWVEKGVYCEKYLK
jgi:hypothetical protein